MPVGLLAAVVRRPAVVGYAVLGDRARPGFLAVAAAGVLLMVGAAVALVRHADGEPVPVAP